MNNLQKQLNNEILHEKDSKSDLSVTKVHVDKWKLKPSKKQSFKTWTPLSDVLMKEHVMNNRFKILKRLNERNLEIQEIKASNAGSGDTDSSRTVSEKGNDQSLENQSNIFGDEISRSRNECNDKGTSGDDTDIKPSYDTEPMVETDQNAKACDDERVALANLIANLKLDIDKNKKIQKQLKKANASLTQELQKCKSTLENKEIELDKYKTYLNFTTEHDTLEHLKAQLQDKNIAISELNKLVEQMKVTPHSWPQVRKSSFAKPYDVNPPGPFRKNQKHLSFQSPEESVGSNNMVHNYYLEEAKNKAQL
nr:hypothetical protein [Tanacetum cinerariifolium]